MKKILIYTLFLVVSVTYGQEKYFIYFKDKGISADKLNKSSELYKKAEENLSQKTIERRKKLFKNDDFITSKDIPVNEEYIKEIKRTGAEIVHTLKWFNAVSAYLNEEQKNEISSFYFVSKIEPVRKLKVEVEEPQEVNSSEDLVYGSSYNQLDISDIPQVHEAGINGGGVLIGILDTGFRWKSHPALQNSEVIAERDFINNDSITGNEPGDVSGQDSHGTSVMSLIGGYEDGKYIGSSYGSSFLLSKTEDLKGESRVEEDNYAAAVEWMEGLGADVITSSLGYSTFDEDADSYTYEDMNGNTTIVSKALNTAFDLGVVTVTSAGNEGNDPWFYITSPADAYNVLAVGAVDAGNSIAYFSSNGPTSDGRIKPEVTAFGVGNYVVSASGGYKTGNGTSYAAPIIAGVTGLLLSAHPHLNNEQVRNIILNTADKADSPNNKRGYGLVSASKAIEYPNVKVLENNNLQIVKSFLNENGLETNSVYLEVIDDDEVVPLKMEKSERDYIADLPTDFDGKYYFNITYSDSVGNQLRIPSEGLYSFDTSDYLVKTVTSVDEPTPDSYALYNNYPNPFNITTTIKFDAKSVEPAALNIYNILGQRIRTLFKGNTSAGINTFNWNGRNDAGQVVASGPYIYSLNIGGKILSKKMVLLK